MAQRNGTHRPWVSLYDGTKTYPTYKELVKALPTLFKEHNQSRIHVARQLRGQFGQRYEYWIMKNGKPVIDEQGWY